MPKGSSELGARGRSEWVASILATVEFTQTLSFTVHLVQSPCEHCGELGLVMPHRCA
jgi:hypothetical protein